jgi:hypothetical protein
MLAFLFEITDTITVCEPFAVGFHHLLWRLHRNEADLPH